eukprot:1344292-Rhodomonas_salina.1
MMTSEFLDAVEAFVEVKTNARGKASRMKAPQQKGQSARDSTNKEEMPDRKDQQHSPTQHQEEGTSPGMRILLTRTLSHKRRRTENTRRELTGPVRGGASEATINHNGIRNNQHDNIPLFCYSPKSSGCI